MLILHPKLRAKTHIAIAEHHEEASHRSRRVSICISTSELTRRSSHEARQWGFVKYICWIIQIILHMRLTSSGIPTMTLDVGRVQRVKIDPKPPNPLVELFRSTDTIRIITNLRRGTIRGDTCNRIEFSWAHFVPSSLPSPKAMGHSEPRYLHAHDTVLALQHNPAGSTGTPNPHKRRPPKLSRSIEPF
jgi:hypothetical protein